MNSTNQSRFLKSEASMNEDDAEKLRQTMAQTNIASEMMLIKSTEDLKIDFSTQLKLRKTIVSLKDKVYRCRALNDRFNHMDLILKK